MNISLLDQLVNPIHTRLSRLCPSHYSQPPPPGFEKLSTNLDLIRMSQWVADFMRLGSISFL